MHDGMAFGAEVFVLARDLIYISRISCKDLPKVIGSWGSDIQSEAMNSRRPYEEVFLQEALNPLSEI